MSQRVLRILKNFAGPDGFSGCAGDYRLVPQQIPAGKADLLVAAGAAREVSNPPPHALSPGSQQNGVEQDVLTRDI